MFKSKILPETAEISSMLQKHGKKLAGFAGAKLADTKIVDSNVLDSDSAQ